MPPVETTEAPAAVEQPKPFDVAAHMANRNAAEHARRTGAEPPKPAEPAKVDPPAPKVEDAPKVAKPEAKIPDDEEDDEKPSHAHLTRRERRALSARDREIGALNERIRQMEASSQTKAAPKAEADPEPQREKFATDREYDRALGRWEGRQGAKEEISKVTAKADQEQEQEQYIGIVRQMDAKANADFELLKTAVDDFGAVLAAANEMDEDLAFAKDSQLSKLIEISEERARMLYHFAKNPDEFKRLKAMGDGPILIRDFGRLETKVEKLYPLPQQGKPAVVQAAEPKEAPKERTAHPAEASAGRNSAERDALKPRPSAEAAARGGSAPPEEPKVGSPAWMAKRNQAQFAR